MQKVKIQGRLSIVDLKSTMKSSHNYASQMSPTSEPLGHVVLDKLNRVTATDIINPNMNPGNSIMFIMSSLNPCIPQSPAQCPNPRKELTSDKTDDPHSTSIDYCISYNSPKVKRRKVPQVGRRITSWDDSRTQPLPPHNLYNP